MKSCIEINNEILKEVSTHLNTLLADEYLLYTKTRNAHWNIQRNIFNESLILIGSQCDSLNIIINDIVERVHELGHFALGSVKTYLKVTRLREQDDDFSNQEQVLKALIDDHVSIIRALRDEITIIADRYKDLETAHLMWGVIEQHEKMSGLLKSHLQKILFIHSGYQGKNVSKPGAALYKTETGHVDRLEPILNADEFSN